MTATGNVVIDGEDLHLSADEVRVDRSTRAAVADGNIRATTGEDTLYGERLEIDLEKETGALFGGTLFLEEDNYHVQAEKIVKSGIDTYSAQDVRVTTCDGESPAWEINGKEFDITYGGYGKVKHGFFKVKEVPVFYTPYMVFPMKTVRQTGLLSPGFDVSQRNGVQISQPFYWAISDSSDATFYLDYISRRGVKLGTEYRYLLSEDDYGMAMFDFLKDRKVDDGSGTTSQDWGYTHDRYLRPNTDRYWFRMKHDQRFDSTSLYLDLDIVSDQDYLYEFRRGKSGFTASASQFLSMFNRELDDYNETVRKNRIGVSNQWPGYSLNAEVRWWDDVIARTQADTDDTVVQSLPMVSFDGYRQPLGGTPLYVAFQTQAAVLYRQNGTTGERIDLYPRIYLPYRLGRLLNIEPSVGGRATLWQIERFDEGLQESSRNRHRELYDFRLDLSSEIYNVYKPDWGGIGGLKHVAKFQVEYDYIPNVDQEDYPYFDGVDRIDGENLITYSIVNTITTRRGEAGAYSYNQAMRLELSQDFDIKRHREGNPEPFGPIEAYLWFNMGKWGNLLADADWSTYSGTFLSRNIGYGVSDGRGDVFGIQHRYTESLLETFKVTATLKLWDSFWLFPTYERNIKDDHMVARSLEAVYRAQCWSLSTLYEEDYEIEGINRHLGFEITFYGLGGVGSGNDRSEGLPSWAK